MTVPSAIIQVSKEGSPETRTTADLLAVIRGTYDLLKGEHDLSPDNMKVNAAVEQLMAHLRYPYRPDQLDAVLSDPYTRMHLPELQDKLGRFEFLTELASVRELMARIAPGLRAIRELPQWSVYQWLVQGELDVWQRCLGQRKIRSIVFVGSGPLPLSALMLHRLGKLPVTCLEVDPAAYEASQKLVAELNPALALQVRLIDGADYDYAGESLIFIASLVANKQAVLAQVKRTCPDAWCAVRTAKGIKQLMYEQIDEEKLHLQGWRIAARTEPDVRRVINSTLFLCPS